MLKTIETIFSGTYKSNAVNIDYKELCKLFDEIKNKNDKSFMPMTPLSLYSSSNKLLSNYLKTFSFNKNIYSELARDILSLLYYFKMPVIGLKWIEQYRPEDRTGPSKILNKDKFLRKSKSHLEEEDSKLKEINDILLKIITILYDIIEALKLEKNMK